MGAKPPARGGRSPHSQQVAHPFQCSRQPTDGTMIQAVGREHNRLVLPELG